MTIDRHESVSTALTLAPPPPEAGVLMREGSGLAVVGGCW